jgi:SAM-dependent methyltransferase
MGGNPMDPQADFTQIESERASWWYIARRNLLREIVSQGLSGKREARILDLGGTAELEIADRPLFRVVNQQSSVSELAFQQIQGASNLVCTAVEELAFASNSFDLIVAGDFLQSAPDDRIALRQLHRVLKDGGLLCLTVPAYSFLWGEDDERRSHYRRYSVSALRRKLTISGFEVQRASYFVATAFLPLAIVRMVRNMFHTSLARDTHYAERGRAVNAVMLGVLGLERQLLHVINLPFGTRVVCWARKPALVTERVTVPAWESQWAAPPLPQGSG